MHLRRRRVAEGEVEVRAGRLEKVVEEEVVMVMEVHLAHERRLDAVRRAQDGQRAAQRRHGGTQLLEVREELACTGREAR
jgi:hypothetical protein